jgi:hypothetical protein
MAPPRRVEPEWLDELAPNDPRAIRSRRDLRRVNSFMLQAGIMQHLLLSACGDERPRFILELGGGDGSFILKVAQGLARNWPGVRVTLLDRQPVVAKETREAFQTLGWNVEVVTADVFAFLEAAAGTQVDVVTANLFLHHFPDARLGQLLAMAAAIAPHLVACEPRRSAWSLGASRLLWAIGCNDVSRHDAAASVRAGFRGTELSALWPRQQGWRLSERPAGLFSHAFVARRADATGPR